MMMWMSDENEKVEFLAKLRPKLRISPDFRLEEDLHIPQASSNERLESLKTLLNKQEKQFLYFDLNDQNEITSLVVVHVCD